MCNSQKVKIAKNAEEAAYFSTNHIPYIVWLNEDNKNQSFPSGAYCVEDINDIDEAYEDRVYRRFKGIPWDIAETPRLKIREIKVEDVKRLYELYRDESITRYMEPLFEDPKQEEEYTKAYIKNVYGFYGYGMWIMDNPHGRDFAYFQGCDPGVSFISEYNPNNGIISVLVSNYGDNVWREMRKIREVLY